MTGHGGKLRIVQVAPFGLHPYSGGLTAIVGLSSALAERGHDVELWQLDPWPEQETGELLSNLRASGVKQRLIPVRKGPWLLGRTAGRLFSECTADVVHLHGAFTFLNSSVARMIAVPFVVSPHGGYADAVLARHSLRKLVFRRLVELPMLQRAALVCALTRLERDQIRLFGYCGPIEVIPNGILASAAADDPIAFRRECGFSESDLLAVFVGRLDIYYKGLDHLVAAMVEAPSWNLALVGPDWKGSRPQLESEIQRLGLQERVKILAPRRRSGLQEALSAADIFVLLSRSEGLPMALLEALSHGTPAVVSPAVEQATGVAEAGCGWVATQADLKACLQSISRQDRAEWARRAENSRSYARGFDWSEVAKTYEQLYSRVAAAGD